jgi:aminopeptidase N
MFPCWDEPAFRATFALTATVPARWANVSNMPARGRSVHGAFATTTFATTPPMPTYLLEYTAGDIASIQGKSGATRLGIWAVRGQQTQGNYALQNAKQILADYDAYFDFPFPLPKLDSIALPGGFNGGMENWGAITYEDLYLLTSPASTTGDRQTVYWIQAHEMAHQWNGDLVTMGWWDDLWLNESFASWRSAKETDERNPSWHWWEGLDVEKEQAMYADAFITSHPIHVAVHDELEAETSFDSEITYSKGQSFLHMLEAYLGPDVFRDGVRRYIKARAYSNATSADLWNGLSAASGSDVGRIASTWVDHAGFPLVSASAACDASGARTITLNQQRFLYQGTDPSQPRWSIPLVIRSGTNGPTQPMLLTQPNQTAPAGRCGEALTLNAGLTGFYRTAYDDATMKSNIAAFGTLPDADRIALLDDQWALALAGRAPLATYFTLAQAMGDDINARAWVQIAGALEMLEVYERRTPGYAAYVTYARSLLKPLALQLGWDARPNETPDVAQLRQEVLLDLGSWGDPGVVAQAQKRFAAFVKNRRAIPVDAQSTILTIVAKNADAATFDRLHAVAKSSTSEPELRRDYEALMYVRDDALAKRALTIALSNEIPPQADNDRVFLVANLNDAHPTLSWRAYTHNVDRLLKPYQSDIPNILAVYVPAGYWNSAPLATIEAFVKPRIPASYRKTLDRGMARARFSVALRKTLIPGTDAYLAGRQ